MGEQTVHADGLTLWAELLGEDDGEVVVLLAGMAMQATAWEDAFMSPFLARGLRVLRFDWRDIGLSTWRSFREHPYRMDDLADDVVRVADAFGCERFHLLGFSMGGCVAQMTALSAPDRLRSLTLLSSGFASPIELTRSERGTAIFASYAKPRPTSDEEVIERQLEQWRLMAGRAADFDETEWRRRVDGWVQRGQNLSCPHLRLRDHVFGVDRTDALRRLAVPTLVLHGTDDPMFPHRHGEAIGANIPNARLELLEGRGHEVFTDPGIARLATEHIAGTI